VNVVNKLIHDKDAIIRSFEAIKESVFDSSDDESKLRSLEAERLEIINNMERLTAENASTAMDQEIYQTRYEGLTDRYRDIEARRSALNQPMQDRLYRKTKTELFLKALRRQEEVVNEFSEDLWHSLADHAEIHGKGDVRFTFKNGMEVRVAC